MPGRVKDSGSVRLVLRDHERLPRLPEPVIRDGGHPPGAQAPTWVAASPLPRLVIRAMRTPASATAAATRNAVCMPLTNASWLIWVIRLAARGGVLWVTGAAPTETALFTPASWAGLRAGRRAAAQLAGSRLLILADMTAPRMAVPRVPPSCMAVDCRPLATPASSTGALPTMTSVAPTMTGDRPRPSSTNQTMVSFGLPVAVSRDRPNRATAASSIPAAMGSRGPALVIRAPDSGAPT